jgi:pyruvate/2-oxoglutarate dehydrogenase complex dihydrolipoamide dehydrogenase (E3) component
MRTNVPNVIAAGDVTGNFTARSYSQREGEVVVNNLTGRAIVAFNAIPA